MKKPYGLNTEIIAAALCSASYFLCLSPLAAAENKVDKATFNGWNIYRTEACGSCHGATAEGSAAMPNLLHSLKSMSKDQFREVLIEGRGIMYSFRDNKTVVEGINDLYTYLKGRSEGTIPAGDLVEEK